MSDSVGPARQPAGIMPRWVGYSIDAATFAIPALLVLIAGVRYLSWYAGIGFVIIWTTSFFLSCISFRRHMTFAVVERLGYIWDVKLTGIQFINPFVDRIVFTGDLQRHAIALFRRPDGTAATIDFIDGSSPIRATGWYQIADPAAIAAWNKPVIREHILKYVYLMHENARDTHIKEVFQTVLRGLLESHPMEVAQEKMTGIIAQATAIIRDALATIGTFPLPENGITVEGLELTPEIEEFRRRAMRGQADAREAENRAPIYSAPFVKMIRRLKKEGIDISTNEVVQVVLAQMGLQVVKDANGSISFISRDVGDVLKTLSVGTVPNGRIGGAP